jgi:hypothetical protein
VHHPGFRLAEVGWGVAAFGDLYKSVVKVDERLDAGNSQVMIGPPSSKCFSVI